MRCATGIQRYFARNPPLRAQPAAVDRRSSRRRPRRRRPDAAPEARALIDLIEERGVPPTHTLTPVEARAFYRDRRCVHAAAPPEVGRGARPRGDGPHGRSRCASIGRRGAARPGVGTAGARLLPRRRLDDRRPRHPRRAVPPARNGSGARVVAVDYRMGPEHRFPAAVDDCLAATRWVRRQAARARRRCRRGSRSAATAPAATSPPWSRSWRATPATCRSPSSC